MKKILLVCMAAALSLSLQSCKSDEAGATAQKYLNALMRMDYETAKSLATEDTRKLINWMPLIRKQLITDSLKAAIKTTKVKIINTEVQGDEALVTYTLDDNGPEQQLKLVKRKDKWLVEESKTEELTRNGVNADTPAEIMQDTASAGITIDTISGK